MGLESVNFIDDFVVTNPVGATDLIAQGDDHIRNIKLGVKQSFPDITKATYIQLTQADVASGATVDLGAQTTDHVQITGTVTITSFGTVAAGVHKTVRFAAALLLTHNGTTLILPGGINITTAADDVLETYSLGGGNWIVTHYSPATGKAVSPPPPTTVRVSTTANVVAIATELNSGDVIDGVTLANDDLVLLKDQTSALENGVYVVSSSPARQVGYNTYDAHSGAHIVVQEGVRNKSAKWQCTSPVGGTLDATAIDWILTSTPIGTVKDYAGLTSRVPAGWFICDGQELVEATFVTLFDALGTSFNTGGETAGSFRVPDCRGRITAGVDGAANRLTTAHASGVDGNTRGNTGGDEAHTLLEAELTLHGHPFQTSTATSGLDGSGGFVHDATNQSTQSAFTGPASGAAGEEIGGTGGGGPHNNVQPTIIMNKIIFAGV